MTASAISIATQLVAQCEGCSLAPYQDPVGVWTIGYGNTFLTDDSRVSADTPPITMTEARSLLHTTLGRVAAQVDALVPEGATDAQRAALYSFAYNLGIGALRKSTLLRMFSAGDTTAAAEQFRAWVYAGGKKLSGLVTRRELERGVFLGTVRFPVSQEENP